MVPLALVRHDGSGSGALDVATAHALLQRVSAGAAPSTLRLYRPGPTVAFGRLDALRPGFAAAARAAREHGFEPVLRAPGGQASAYQRESVVLDLAVADADAITGVQTRFAELAALLAGALRSLGVDARVGAVPGEYCPGAHSVNAGGRVKLVGTAQRIVRGGWLFAASVVVRDAEPVRAVLEAVYDRLGVAWDPARPEPWPTASRPSTAPASRRRSCAPSASATGSSRPSWTPRRSPARAGGRPPTGSVGLRGAARRTRSARRTAASACCGPRRPARRGGPGRPPRR